MWMGDNVPDSIADPYVGLEPHDLEDEDDVGEISHRSDLSDEEPKEESSELKLFGNDLARQFCLFFRVCGMESPVVITLHNNCVLLYRHRFRRLL